MRHQGTSARELLPFVKSLGKVREIDRPSSSVPTSCMRQTFWRGGPAPRITNGTAEKVSGPRSSSASTSERQPGGCAVSSRHGRSDASMGHHQSGHASPEREVLEQQVPSSSGRGTRSFSRLAPAMGLSLGHALNWT